MTKEEVAKLTPGIYHLYWNGAEGSSLAAVGKNVSGKKTWMAPVYWNKSCKSQEEWDCVVKAVPALIADRI